MSAAVPLGADAARRALVWMPTGRDAERAAGLLGGVGVATYVCRELAELCRELRAGADGVVTSDDCVLGGIGSLCEALREQPAWSAIPFVVVAHEGAQEKVQRSMIETLRNVIVVERPVRARSLTSVVLSALRGRQHQYQIRDAMLLRDAQTAEAIRLNEALAVSQRELERHAEQLRSNDRRKDEFLATLAHELRNPLAPIRTGIEVLGQTAANESERETLGVMGRQLTHLVRLIDDLLDISRVTRGKLELRFERVTVGSIVEAAVEACRPQIALAGHLLTVDVEAPNEHVEVDPTRIAQVVANLLSNACKYTPSRGRIDLVVRLTKSELDIVVTDDGIGIPAARVEEIFEMFNQVDAAIERAQGGLGIGLALVRRLVEMHGGVVNAASEGEGRGSSFRVVVPRIRMATGLTSIPPPTTHASMRGAGRVLVVDDNVDAADLLAVMLGQSGYSVTAVYDSESAIAEVAAEPPKLVILDIGLPVMNGYEVAREIRKRSPRGQLGLIALTGWGTAEDRRKAMEAGFDVHLTKPIDVRALQDAIARVEQALADRP